MNTKFIPQDQNSLQQKINSLDLEPIIYKLVNPEDGDGWSVEKADTVAAQYKQFLTLCGLHPTESIVPSKDIDKIWHTHILDTEKYIQDCEEIFGYFLHHFPYFGIRGEEDAKKLSESFENTKKLFLTHFGTTIVKDATTCGQSCNSSLCNNTGCDTNSCTPSSKDRQRPRLDRVALAM